MKLSLLLVAGVAGITTICDLCGPDAGTAAVRNSATLVADGAPPVPMVTASDTVTLKIEGMTCAGCTIATRTVLARLDGIEKADVSYERKLAVVTYDPAKVTTRQMIAAVATLGYTATVVR